ncbi:hypothetical protein [Micromonospora sp. CV4]|uniref:hypothetical protein n=1 Tax=Micromonospora sp. CV4 TaxID=2478711 RepID=UPI0013156A38|nr:hypothetical protein [Micromonospora sp. CV4]
MRPGRRVILGSTWAPRLCGRAVAERLGYRTNPLARALTTSRTHMIALVIPDISNPVYAETCRYVSSSADRRPSASGARVAPGGPGYGGGPPPDPAAHLS